MLLRLIILKRFVTYLVLICFAKKVKIYGLCCWNVCTYSKYCVLKHWNKMLGCFIHIHICMPCMEISFRFSAHAISVHSRRNPEIVVHYLFGYCSRFYDRVYIRGMHHRYATAAMFDRLARNASQNDGIKQKKWRQIVPGRCPDPVSKGLIGESSTRLNWSLDHWTSRTAFLYGLSEPPKVGFNL